MNFTLSAFAEEQGYQVESYDCVGSTNHIALTKGLQENKDKLWVVARQQTAAGLVQKEIFTLVSY